MTGCPANEDDALPVVHGLGSPHDDPWLWPGRPGRGGGAEPLAETRASDAVVNRPAPICVVRLSRDPEKAEKLLVLKDTDPGQRDGYIEKQGWATMPGEK